VVTTPSPERVEAAARAICVVEGFDPDAWAFKFRAAITAALVAADAVDEVRVAAHKSGREAADENIAYLNTNAAGSHDRHVGAGWCCEYHDGYEDGWDALREALATQEGDG
jgi:hypothetical protein